KTSEVITKESHILITSLTSRIHFYGFFFYTQKGGEYNKAMKKLYEDLSDILDISSGWLYDDLLRNIGWGIIQLLVWINDWIEGVATKIVSLGGLYDSSDMNGFIDVLQPLAIGLFVVSVTVLGFMF